MKKQVFNPFLPLNVCIPDGEPHVFGDRVYLFGSHETPGGSRFCNQDYEFFSAPVWDLSDWSSKGINYSAKQDPDYGEKFDALYAPDVVQGTDGRFYLYYALSGKAFTGPIHVAVCDTPDGKYQYYGAVRNPDGSTFDHNITFDPAVINDGGTIRLYYGWSLAVEEQKARGLATGGQETLYPIYQFLFGKTPEQIEAEQEGLMGAFTVELDKDMLTVRSVPKRIVPGQFDSFDTEFEGHAFFEGSSIRKIGGIYYFIYTSQHQHELCYAMSQHPDRDFRYGGVIISNGDIGMDGRRSEDRIAATGNNHGSIEKVGQQWYVFYHRQTHKHCFSRQACAEKITILPDGSIPQVRLTSCGLQKEPLQAQGVILAAYCCGLTNGQMPHLEVTQSPGDIPHITHEGDVWYAAELTNESTLIFRDIAFAGKTSFSVRYRGDGGRLCLRAGTTMTEKQIDAQTDWADCTLSFEKSGIDELQVQYLGHGKIDILELIFNKE